LKKSSPRIGQRNSIGQTFKANREALQEVTWTGMRMTAPNDLKGRLSRYREINLSVTGRRSGRTISQPVWFVFDDDKVYLLPVRGSDTQWYKNVLKYPSIRIDARGADAEFQAVLITDQTRVSSVVEKFRTKYGTSDVKKYYSKFDVAVVAQMR
jgi:deazaflavin-dependent oxidoreductase (nitroreductase family)